MTNRCLTHCGATRHLDMSLGVILYKNPTDGTVTSRDPRALRHQRQNGPTNDVAVLMSYSIQSALQLCADDKCTSNICTVV